MINKINSKHNLKKEWRNVLGLNGWDAKASHCSAYFSNGIQAFPFRVQPLIVILDAPNLRPKIKQNSVRPQPNAIYSAPNETFFEPIIPRRLGQDLGVEVLDT